MDYPQRKHPRLKNYDYSQNGAYFVTICTKDKRPIVRYMRSQLWKVNREISIERSLITKDSEDDVTKLSGGSTDSSHVIFALISLAGIEVSKDGIRS